MKFVWHWEWDLKDIEMETELSNKFQEAIKKFPDKFPQMGPTRFTGRSKGFRVIEAENEEQLLNLVTFWAPTECWKLTPFFEGYSVAWQHWNEWRTK